MDVQNLSGIKKLKVGAYSTIECFETELDQGSDYHKLSFSIKKCQFAQSVLALLGNNFLLKQQFSSLQIKIGKNLFIGEKGFENLFRNFESLINLEELSLVIKQGNHFGQNYFTSIKKGLLPLQNLKKLNLEINEKTNILNKDLNFQKDWFFGLINLKELSLTLESTLENVNLLKDMYLGIENIKNLEKLTIILIKNKLQIDQGFEIISKQLTLLENLKYLKIKTKNLDLYENDVDQIQYLSGQELEFYKNLKQNSSKFWFGLIHNLQGLKQLQELNCSVSAMISLEMLSFLVRTLKQFKNIQNIILQLSTSSITFSELAYQLNQIPQISSLKILKSNSLIQLIEVFNFCVEIEALKNLKDLSITLDGSINSCTIENELLIKCQSRLNKLDGFNFESNKIYELSIIQMLRGVRSLKKIYLDFDQSQEGLNYDSLNDKLDISENIREIHLDFSDIILQKQLNFDFFKSSNKQNKVESLDLDFPNDLQFSYDQYQNLHSLLSTFQNLKKLDLGIRFQLSEDQQNVKLFCSFIQQLKDLQTIEIFIKEQSFNDQSTELFFDSFSHLQNLKSLTIYMNKAITIEEKAIKILQKTLKSLTQLKILKLSFMQVNLLPEDVVNLIVGIQEMKYLKQFQLKTGAYIGKEDSMIIYDILKNKKNLKSIQFQPNSLAVLHYQNLFNELPFLINLEDMYSLNKVQRRGQNRNSYELIFQQATSNDLKQQNDIIRKPFDISKQYSGIFQLSIQNQDSFEDLKWSISKIQFPTYLDQYISFKLHQEDFKIQTIKLFKSLEWKRLNQIY